MIKGKKASLCSLLRKQCLKSLCATICGGGSVLSLEGCDSMGWQDPPGNVPSGWELLCNSIDDHTLFLLLTSKEPKRQTGFLCLQKGGFASAGFVGNQRESSHQEQIIWLILSVMT